MAFWKKIFKSKYTGAEIDAAVAKAGNLPATTSADAGKALVVDEQGKIVAGEAGGNQLYIIEATTTDMSTFTCNESKSDVETLLSTYPVVLIHLVADMGGTTIDFGMFERDRTIIDHPEFKNTQIQVDDGSPKSAILTRVSLGFEGDLTKTIYTGSYNWTVTDYIPS